MERRVRERLPAQPPHLRCARLFETPAEPRKRPPCGGLLRPDLETVSAAIAWASFGCASPFAFSGVAPRLLALHHGKSISAHTCRKDIASSNEEAGEIAAARFLLALAAIGHDFILIPSIFRAEFTFSQPPLPLTHDVNSGALKTGAHHI